MVLHLRHRWRVQIEAQLVGHWTTAFLKAVVVILMHLC